MKRDVVFVCQSYNNISVNFLRAQNLIKISIFFLHLGFFDITGQKLQQYNHRKQDEELYV